MRRADIRVFVHAHADAVAVCVMGDAVAEVLTGIEQRLFARAAGLTRVLDRLERFTPGGLAVPQAGPDFIFHVLADLVHDRAHVFHGVL